MEAKVLRPDVVGIPSSDRVTLLLAEHATARMRDGAAGAGAGAGGGAAAAGGAPLAGPPGEVNGYPRAFAEQLRAKLNSDGFGQVTALLTHLNLDGVPAGPGGVPAAAPPAHPFTIITAIMRAREMISTTRCLGTSPSCLGFLSLPTSRRSAPSRANLAG